MKKFIKSIALILIVTLIALLLIRLITPREIDDLNPLIYCEREYIDKSETLWIIPYYDEIPISENKEWCEEILSLNKTLGLHGIKHQPYREFNTQNVSQEQLDEAIKIFEECFNQTPTMFKPPQLKINSQNKKLLKENNFFVRNSFHQIIRKVYHCSDTGNLPNKFHDIF